jgi:predicted transcriptional regulator
LRLPRAKRNKLEIYNDVLNAIRLDLMDGDAKPTRIASRSNFAYDKLTRYLGELEGKAMITQNPLAITEKGRDFIQDYDRISGFLQEMGVKYLAIPRKEAW